MEVAEAAARAAGGVIMERFSAATGVEGKATIKVEFKGRNNLVTDTDRAAEVAALGVLGGEYPGFGVLAEESGRSGGGEFTWVVDPLDGTRNFASRLPQFAVNVALLRGDEVLLGLTFDPVRDELFTAEAGGGAFLGSRRVEVSSAPSLEESVLGFDLGYVDDRAAQLLDVLRALWPGVQALRIFGSAALGFAYVAAGRLQLYAHHNVAPWDIAPGLLLVREAGGVATDLRGDPATPASPSVIAGAASVHAQFMAATEGSAWRGGS